MDQASQVQQVRKEAKLLIKPPIGCMCDVCWKAPTDGWCKLKGIIFNTP